jgi:hypothetical protein
MTIIRPNRPYYCRAMIDFWDYARVDVLSKNRDRQDAISDGHTSSHFLFHTRACPDSARDLVSALSLPVIAERPHRRTSIFALRNLPQHQQSQDQFDVRTASEYVNSFCAILGAKSPAASCRGLLFGSHSTSEDQSGHRCARIGWQYPNHRQGQRQSVRGSLGECARLGSYSPLQGASMEGEPALCQSGPDP